VVPVALAIALVVPIMAVSPALASPIDDQRAEVGRITDELERLAEEADIQGERYNTYLIEGQELQKEIDKAEERVAAKQAEVDRVRGDLSRVAVDAFVGSSSGGLSPVFQDADAYRQSQQAEQYSKVALSAGAATTDDLDEVVSDLTAEQEDLEAKREEAAALAEKAADAKEVAEAQKAEYEQRRQEAEAELGQLIEEEEQRRAEEAYRQMLAEREAAAEREQQDDSDSNTGPQPIRNPQTPAQPDTPDDSDTPDTPDTPDEPDTPDTPDEPENPAPPPSTLGGIAVNAAMSQIGVPYRYAASEPGVAFDCSGLTSWAWGRAGVGLPHQSAQQYAVTPHVSTSDAQPGDLVFYYSPISHVAMYVGGGQQIHAPYTGSSVHVKSIDWGNVVGVSRPG
jgi:cell wall-associated NlpC family hydrolase